MGKLSSKELVNIILRWFIRRKNLFWLFVFKLKCIIYFSNLAVKTFIANIGLKKKP